jgi:hypothetical protein
VFSRQVIGASFPRPGCNACWITAIGGTLFASNADSATVSSVADTGGALTMLGQTGTDAGTVDSAATPDGRYLYVQAGGC